MGHNETVSSIESFVGKRNAFIDVCVGPALAQMLQLDQDTAAFPLKPLGNHANVSYGVELIRLLGVRTDRNFQETAVAQGRIFQSVVALVHCGLSPEELRRAKEGTSAHVSRSRALVSFFLAGELVPFIRFAWLEPGKGEAEFLAPRGLNGVPNRHPDDPVSHAFLQKVHVAVENDDLFHYYLGLLQAAEGEADPSFRIARLFSLLESLAGPITGSLKQVDKNVGSRTGVRVLLGYYLDFDIPIFTVDGTTEYEFDHIELAGQLRDRLFHGAAILKEDEVKDALKLGVQLLHINPSMIAHALRRDCEIELVRYAERTGRSWRSRNGESISLPERIPSEQLKQLAKLHVTGTSVSTGNIGSAVIQVTGPSAAFVKLKLSI